MRDGSAADDSSGLEGGARGYVGQHPRCFELERKRGDNGSGDRVGRSLLYCIM